MNKRLGASIHEESGFRVVEVFDDLSASLSVLGYTIEGPSVEPLMIYPDVRSAIEALRSLAAGKTPWPETRSADEGQA